VRAALHDRNPGEVRAFISSLSGAEGHLYEYLAEEVIGELPDDLQQFLMRTSVLETVDLTLGPVAADVSVEEATRLIEEGERHGLFGRSGSRARHVVRAHPLVRSFLQARLRQRTSTGGVAEIHRKVATAARDRDWSVAAAHFIAAGCETDAEEVMTDAIERILGSGAYAAAEELSSAITGGLKGHAGLVLRSRIAQQSAARDEGLVLAEEAWAAAPKSAAGLLNLVSARHLAGDIEGAVSAGRLLEGSGGSYISRIGGVFRRILETSLTGGLQEVATELVGLVDSRRHGADRHFTGVGLLNLAYVALPMGRPEQALEAADEAITLLGATSTGVDAVAARLARGAALAYLGRMDEGMRRGQSLQQARQQLRRGNTSSWPMKSRRPKHSSAKPTGLGDLSRTLSRSWIQGVT
jgi:ATP/maltotriose-dependent transcriptional regulator MalT